MRIITVLMGALSILMASTDCLSLSDTLTTTTFESSPPGATISYNGNNLGVAPVTVSWWIDENGKGILDDDDKPSFIKTIKATWISGASTTIKIEMNRGVEKNYTLLRPKGAVGVNGDIQWGIHIQQQNADAKKQLEQKRRDDASARQREAQEASERQRIEAAQQRAQEQRDYEFGQSIGNAISRGLSSGSGGGGTTLCPDGTYVGGNRCVLAPNGKYVGGY